MTKTSKYGVMLFITAVGLQASRILANVIVAPDNYVSWGFSLFFQVFWLGVLPYLLYRFWISKDKQDFLRDMRIKTKINPLIYVLSPIVGIFLFYTTMYVSSFWNNMIMNWGFVHGNNLGTIYSSPAVLIMDIICTAMLPGIFEEIANRGIGLNALGNRFSEQQQIAIIAVFFGLFHQNAPQLGYAIYGGAILAYVTIKTASIIPAMIIHFTNNFIATILDYGQQKGNSLGRMYDRLMGLSDTNPLLLMATFVGAFGLIYLATREIGRISARATLLQNAKTALAQAAEGQPPKQAAPKEPKTQIIEYIPLAAAVLVAVLGSIFSFIWGMR